MPYNKSNSVSLLPFSRLGRVLSRTKKFIFFIRKNELIYRLEEVICFGEIFLSDKFLNDQSGNIFLNQLLVKTKQFEYILNGFWSTFIFQIDSISYSEFSPVFKIHFSERTSVSPKEFSKLFLNSGERELFEQFSIFISCQVMIRQVNRKIRRRPTNYETLILYKLAAVTRLLRIISLIKTYV